MLWLVLAISAAILSSISSVLYRKVMLEEDEFVYAFFLNIVPFIIFLPIAIVNWQPVSGTDAWLALLVGSTTWAVLTVINMLSYKHTEVSSRATLIETRTIWVLVLAMIILSEALTWEKVIGSVTVFIGVVIITYHKDATLSSLKDRGVQFTFLAAFLLGLAAVLDKNAMRFFTPEVYTMLSCSVPLAVLTPYILTQRRKELKGMLSRRPWFAIGAATLGTIVYYLSIKAFYLEEVSLVYPVLRMSIVFSVLGGIILLREREHMARKIIASVIVLLGVLVASGYYALS